MSLDHPQCHGDGLLSRLLCGEVGGGELENSLLVELHQGYPINKLRLLLKASDEKIVAAGMWLASEVGAAARPLLADIAGLIHHPFSQVRFFALDCLLACARPEDKQVVVLALGLIDDSQPSVRWKTLVFLATAPDALLQAAHDAIRAGEYAGTSKKGLDLLLNATAACDSAAVTAGLASSDPVLRRYAAAAAARLFHHDSGLLKQALASADPTIRQFAADMAARAGTAATSSLALKGDADEDPA